MPDQQVHMRGATASFLVFFVESLFGYIHGVIGLGIKIKGNLQLFNATLHSPAHGQPPTVPLKTADTQVTANRTVPLQPPGIWAQTAKFARRLSP